MYICTCTYVGRGCWDCDQRRPSAYSSCGNFPSKAAHMTGIHQRYRQTDGETDLRWQYRTLHYVCRAVKITAKSWTAVVVSDRVVIVVMTKEISDLLKKQNHVKRPRYLAIPSYTRWGIITGPLGFYCIVFKRMDNKKSEPMLMRRATASV